MPSSQRNNQFQKGSIPNANTKQLRGETTPPLTLSQVLLRHRQLIILGEAGGGKSTTLQYIALQFAKGSTIESMELHETRVPVLIPLRAYATRIAEDGLMSAIASAFSELANISVEHARTFIQQWQDDGKLIVLLDGLDELPANQQKETITNALRIYHDRARQKGNRLVASSRLTGYTPFSSSLAEFILTPFEDDGDIFPYVLRWISIFRQKDPAHASKQTAQRFVVQIGANQGLKRIRDNPLLLRLAIQIYSLQGQLIENRAALYRYFLEDVAWDRAKSRGFNSISKTIALQALDAIAWHFQTQARFDIQSVRTVINNLHDDPDKIIDLLRKGMGILIYVGSALDRQVAFNHLTFQEYFVARRLKTAWLENKSKGWKYIFPRLHHPEWREPILLLESLQREENPDEAQALLERIWRANSPYEKVLFRDLDLTIALISQGAPASPKLIRTISNRVYNFLSFRSVFVAIFVLGFIFILGLIAPFLILPWYWGVAIVAIWAGYWKWQQEFPFNSIIRYFSGNLGASDNAASNVVMDAAAQSVEIFLPVYEKRISSIWYKMVSRVVKVDQRRFLLKGLGKIDDPRVHSIIYDLARKAPTRTRDEDLQREEAMTRADAVKILGTIRNNQSLDHLIYILNNDSSMVVRNDAAESLGNQGFEQAVPYLLKALEINNTWFRSTIYRALGNIGDTSTIPILIDGLTESGTKSAAWDALKQIGGNAVFQGLFTILRLENEDDEIDYAIFDIIKEITPTLTPKVVYQALQDNCWRIRLIAAFTIGQMKLPEGRTYLRPLLEDKNDAVVATTYEALGILQDAAIFEQAIAALYHNNPLIQVSAIEALGSIGNAEAIPHLISIWEKNLVEDDSRHLIVESLGKFHEPTLIPFFLSALNNANYNYIQGSAAAALGALGDYSTVKSLVENIQSDSQVKMALIQIQSPETIPLLINNLQANRGVVATVELLGFMPHYNIDAKEAVPSLIKSLKNKNYRYSNELPKAVASTLGYIGDPTAVPVLIKLLESTKDTYIRENVVRALGNIGDARAVPALLKISKHPKFKSGFLSDTWRKAIISIASNKNVSNIIADYLYKNLHEQLPYYLTLQAVIQNLTLQNVADLQAASDLFDNGRGRKGFKQRK